MQLALLLQVCGRGVVGKAWPWSGYQCLDGDGGGVTMADSWADAEGGERVTKLSDKCENKDSDVK